MRCIDGTWYAYGTPWCGKDGINQNKRVPIAGICYLKQGDVNAIRTLDPQEAMIYTICQTTKRLPAAEIMSHMLANVDAIVGKVPMYELENKPELAAAQLSYETMRAGSKV